MKTKEPLLVIVPLIICVVAVVIAYNSTISVRKLKRSSEEEIQLLKNKVTKLAAEFKSINEMLANKSPKGNMRITAGGTKQTKDWLTMLDNDLQKIEKTLSQTGLNLLATNEVDPVLFKEMFAEFSDKKELQTYQEQLKTFNTELHEYDKDKYDAKIAELYQNAKSMMGRRGNSDTREKAFNEMLDKYPDSYSTGMLIAERAIGASFRGKTEDIEKYYKMINDNDNFQDIVIDWGAEAVPTIQYQLANRYINDGRIDDAKKILIDLEEKGGDGYILAPSSGRRRPTWQKKSDIINDLNQKLY